MLSWVLGPPKMDIQIKSEESLTYLNIFTLYILYILYIFSICSIRQCIFFELHHLEMIRLMSDEKLLYTT